MIGKDSILYSLRNLNHRKGRSFLTVFSILIGIAAIFIFISFGVGLYEYVGSFTTGSSADKVLIMAKGSGIPGMDDTIKLDDDDLKSILRTAGVYEASGVYFDVIKVEKRDEIAYTYLSSYDPSMPLLEELLDIKIEKGRDLQKGDTGVVLGYNFMIDGKIFDKGLELNELIVINGERFRVLGFMSSVGNPSDDANVYVTNENFLNIFPNKTSYAEIVARVDLDNINWVVENIERNLRNSRNVEKGKEDFFVQSFEDMIESYSGALDVIIGFVILIALISVLVSAINTVNTMITSVLERYREIGVLKAIGARNSEIFGIFLFESAFLGFIAGILGVLLGWGITSFAGMILDNLGWGFLSPSNNIFIFIGCVLFAVLTGAFSGVIPAIRASKINTVDALRYE